MQEKIRHSLAHILALAVKQEYPEVKLGMGPAIENGFYYDFDNLKIEEKDLKKIEKKIRHLIKQNIKFEQKEISKKEAKEIFKDEPYKLEIIEDVEGDNVSIYTSGDLIDLCFGPHIESTKEIDSNAFKLNKIAGAYFKGSEKNPMLTRIYGIAFENKEKLDEFIKAREEAKKRDHRLLGQTLELFMFDEEVGAGLPLWLPNGATIIRLLKSYLHESLREKGYQLIQSPHIGKIDLWKTSGHWENYRDDLYSPMEVDEEQYLIKPMNCPFHIKMYKYKPRSYKELPLRFYEFGTVYRYERSGVLSGLTRVRGFTQDDAHIWCTEEQLNDELTKLFNHGMEILSKFGFKDFNVYLSTKPEKYVGTDEGWNKTENILKRVLKDAKIDYNIDEGGGSFYGPKIDVKVKDALNREWQCTTIQLDFNLPERFDMTYIDKDGNKKRPYMIHRALLGSIERFIGVLLEYHSGNLPFWLSPVQVKIIPVSEKHLDYANEVKELLKDLRVEVNENDETVSKKIREAVTQKIPYVLTVGDKEKGNNTISVRKRGNEDLGEMSINKFIKLENNK